jgi:hypothetical protein
VKIRVIPETAKHAASDQIRVRLVRAAFPVTLPPGRERLATRPMPIGSTAIANTMGIEVVAFYKVVTAPP